MDTDIITNGVIDIGNIVTIDHIDWRVVHIDNKSKECILAKEYWETDRDFVVGKSTKYLESDIKYTCDAFLHRLSIKTQLAIATKNIHGVEAKIWIPQSNWISSNLPYHTAPEGTWAGINVFEYFKEDADRIYKSIRYTSKYWMTASPYDKTFIWLVSAYGWLRPGNPHSLNGFRPFMCLKL